MNLVESVTDAWSNPINRSSLIDSDSRTRSRPISSATLLAAGAHSDFEGKKKATPATDYFKKGG